MNDDAVKLPVSLRDWFAGQAPPPPAWWMISYAKGASDLTTYAGVITQWNYCYADAMLAEREKR